MRDLKTQFVSALLFVLTVAAVCCALVNFRQQSLYHLPDDGVTWVDRIGADGQNLVLALHVTPGSPGYNSGIRAGDALLEVAGHAIAKTLDVPQALQRVGIWQKTEYLLRRNGVPVPAQVIVGEGVLDRSLYYQYAVGIAYLLIGLFVYYRRVGASRSVHFYVLCLASFVLSCFHFTGKLNAFDQVIYWGNVVAGVLAPTIFLHFCLVFPDRPKWLERRGLSLALYAPGAVLLTFYLLVAKGILQVTASPVEVNWFLDRLWLLFLIGFYLAGTVVLAIKTPQAEDPLVRRQLKYLRNGALLGVVPFTLIYAVPYLFGALPGTLPEDGRTLHDSHASDLGLRDPALPADGRRHHFPTRLRLHASDAGGAGHLLWADLLVHQAGRPQPGGDRGVDFVRDLHLPAHSRLATRTTGPLFLLQRPL